MNHLFDRAFALCGLAVLLAAAWMGQLAHAQDEPPIPPPPTPSGNVLITRHCTGGDDGSCARQTIVIRRFPIQPGEIIDMRDVRNIGRHLKDGPFLAEPLAEFPIDVTGKFVRSGCACAAAGECVCASQATCGHECAAAKADSSKCCPCADHTEEATCGEESCEATDILIHRTQHIEHLAEHDPLKLMQHIAGLVGEKAAAQAALAVRKEADEQIGELVETMAELLADNAALDAKLEAQTEAHAEQRKLLEKVADLAAENARLKAHVELAAERAEIARSTAALTLENERLKLRIVELEQKHALAEAARTAAKPKERKGR